MQRKLWGLALAFGTSCALGQAPAPALTMPPPPPKLAIVGGTLVDLADYGRRTKDLADAVVVTDGDRIIAVGKRGEVEIPKDAEVIDAAGKYIVPGYIDGFSVQNNESQARAHLYMGVTTVSATDNERRRGMSEPVPGGPNYARRARLFGYDVSRAGVWQNNRELRMRGRRLTPAQVRQHVESKAWDGYEVALAYYTLDREQLEAAATQARESGLMLIGELGATRYLDAARAGVPFFVHANRYLLDLAPDDIRTAAADDAFGEGALAYKRYLGTIDPEGDAVKAYGQELAKHRVALMPTFALWAAELPNQPNPWREKVASILDPRDVMPGMDPKGGDNPPLEQMDERRQALAKSALRLMAIHRTLRKSGVEFVVGSGADAFGVLPGVGVHMEMALLVEIGLTPREALAAATANYPATVNTLEYGRVAPGARADVLVLAADPTRDIANAKRIDTVVLRGRAIPREALLGKPPASPAP